MAGNYQHTIRTDNTTLTAAIYNEDHQNHVNNNVAQSIDDYSSSVAQMQATTDPGEVGSESLADSLAAELERLRFAIAEAKGTNQWYETPVNNLSQSTISPIGIEVFS